MHPLINTIINFTVDAFKYIKFSSAVFESSSKKNLQADLLRISHAIEKGMALPNPKKKFGVAKFLELLDLINKYKKLYRSDKILLISLSTCDSYLKFHKKKGHKMNELRLKFKKIFNGKKIFPYAGNLNISKKKIKDLIKLKKPEAFFLNRHSTRQFVKKIIKKDIFNRLALLTSKTPSVCNRQSGKIYFYNEKEKIRKILELQNGNKGFGDTSGAIAIVTSELSNFYTPGERNQGYVDGGLFAMSLVYAAHSLGLVTCMLNWSNGAKSTFKLRKLTGIKSSEIVITMIALGHMKDDYVVAASPRKNFKDFLTINKRLKNF